MSDRTLNKFTSKIPFLRAGGIAGITIISLTIITRLTGFLQPLEWSILDLFLRSRPLELTDDKITIIGINETDINNSPSYPIPDRDMAVLINKIQQYKPVVIGLDNVRDKPVEPGHKDLVTAFKKYPNIMGIEKVIDNGSETILPPPALSADNLGFSDATPDADGKLRRNYLTVPVKEDYKFSLSLRLSEAYLNRQGWESDEGIKDANTIRFTKESKSVELPRFYPNSGSYVRTDDGGLQVLVNYRNSQKPFHKLSLTDIKTNNFSQKLITGKIILIGITSQSHPDIINSNAVKNNVINGQIYGVEYQAHAASQIVNGVLSNRPFLNTWTEAGDYLWICGWGMLGIVLSCLSRSPLKNLLSVLLGSIILIGTSYALILFGWWIPVVPALLVFSINGIALTAFYQYDRFLRLQIEERRLAIVQAFDAIHNSPLQEIALLLRELQGHNLREVEVIDKIKHVNTEIRDIFDRLIEETIEHNNVFYLGEADESRSIKLDLSDPIHQLFAEVYEQTIIRDFPHFKTIKIPIVNFKLLEEDALTIEQKGQLCRFLEEAICNVGKHAECATKISVTGEEKDGWYALKIEDNGIGVTSNARNRGTKQAQSLAEQLRGKFIRKSMAPKGTLCQLSFPIRQKSSFFSFWLANR
ncbi:CHASE2 domain-containing protein [Merismopedia glauca]|uniref:Histidine kinase n=1 Tax=Merismopedia glauca CCAP 1448/3 TaxID=1296344 RepID=A0A2T1BYM4_9CYAN|nr:CHASE2 domain-containing protein [Merismopedia glauca]PSB01017.1 histidine kinase [Merismopedia glauca CCAP 1448/3]